jgi:type IV pilus assembly protein PilV
MSSRISPVAQKGFTLIEVMVALLVISIGLLGIAKMQALALASTGTARMRSVAAIEAASIASMMHSDRAYWAGISSGTEKVTVTASSSSFSSTDTSVTLPTGCTATAPSPCCTPSLATPCSAAQLAAQDLTLWAYDLNQTMPPNTTATIKCPAGTATTPVSCTVQIDWTENLIDINTGMNTALTTQQNVTALQNTATTHFLLFVEP